MHPRVIDGKAVAASVRAEVAKEVATLKAAHGLTPGLAVVLVGEDPASKVYVKNKGEQTKECGMNSWEYKLPAETSEADILAIVDKLNKTIVAQLNSPALQQRYNAQGLDTIPSTSAQYIAKLKSETEKWAKVVRAANIKQQ